jgi:peptide deformylase
VNYKLLTAPHPNLRKKARPIKQADKKLISNQELLIQALNDEQDPPGVGMAFTQIDKLIRGFAFRPSADKNKETIIMLNPEIVSHSEQLSLGENPKEADLEGCLSVPKIYGPVWRWQWIELTYQIAKNNQLVNKKGKFSDYEARIIQHEIDHLEGVLFTDRLIEQDQPAYLKENDDFIPIEGKTLLKVY